MSIVYLETPCLGCGGKVRLRYSHSTPPKIVRFCSQRCSAVYIGKSKNKGGCIMNSGYVLITVNGRRLLEHRYVMEQHIGRKLLRSEIVHHKDGNKIHNSIDNLELVESLGLHNKMHAEVFRSDTHKECARCHEIKLRSEFTPNRLQGKAASCDPSQSYCNTSCNRTAADRRANR